MAYHFFSLYITRFIPVPAYGCPLGATIRAYQDFRLARQYFVILCAFNDSCIFFTHSFLRCRTLFGCFCGKSGQKPVIPIWKVYTILLPAVNIVDACNTDQRSLKLHSDLHLENSSEGGYKSQNYYPSFCDTALPVGIPPPPLERYFRRSCESSVFEIVLPLCFLLQ